MKESECFWSCKEILQCDSLVFQLFYEGLYIYDADRETANLETDGIIRYRTNHNIVVMNLPAASVLSVFKNKFGLLFGISVKFQD